MQTTVCETLSRDNRIPLSQNNLESVLWLQSTTRKRVSSCHAWMVVPNFLSLLLAVKSKRMSPSKCTKIRPQEEHEEVSVVMMMATKLWKEGANSPGSNRVSTRLLVGQMGSWTMEKQALPMNNFHEENIINIAFPVTVRAKCGQVEQSLVCLHTQEYKAYFFFAGEKQWWRLVSDLNASSLLRELFMRPRRSFVPTCSLAFTIRLR